MTDKAEVRCHNSLGHSQLATMMFIILCTLVATSIATNVYQSPYYLSTGTSQQYRKQDASGNYRFGYDESHADGGTFRDETGDAWGNKYGSYGLREADGRYRVVNYVADSQGFRANIKTNEPGIVPKDPASTTINKELPSFSTKNPPPKIVQQEVLYEPKEIEETVVQKPVLYADPSAAVASAPVVHHAFNPEYPLLYHSSYYAPYSNYKGTPYGTYKGAPYGTYKGTFIQGNYKGSPFRRYGVSPIIGSRGYYIYP